MSVKPFTHTFTLRFHEADPAGIMFFGNVYKLAHNAYEEFLVHLGFELKHWFHNPDWGVPVRQSSCEYFAPLVASRTFGIRVLIEKIGTTSFTLTYDFVADGKTYCQARLVHTFIDIKAMKKRDLPSDVRKRFEAYQRECLASQ